MKSNKPLGMKSYGSIGHLPNSRMGPSDHHCHSGQAKIATEKARDKHDIIIVQEKLDGSNVGVARLNDEIIALTRSGYLASTSKFEQHHVFAKWVKENQTRFMDVLNNGERLCGEWLLQAHGTRYKLNHEPFVVFDLMLEHKRTSYYEFNNRIGGKFIIPYEIHWGGPMSIERAMELLGPHGHHGAVDNAEGAVWRVERATEVDFVVKYVRPDKVDGIYLPEISGSEPVFNWIFS